MFRHLDSLSSPTLKPWAWHLIREQLVDSKTLSYYLKFESLKMPYKAYVPGRRVQEYVGRNDERRRRWNRAARGTAWDLPDSYED